MTIRCSLGKGTRNVQAVGSSYHGVNWLPGKGEDTKSMEWTVREPNIFTRHRVVCSVSGCTVGRYAKGTAKPTTGR